jgi:CMP-N-acetylneuraminic acid synthetase
VRTLCIIPARAGSVRLAEKNLRELGGKPLVVRALEAALAASQLDHVVVSSDSEAILRLAEQTCEGSALLRPSALATAQSPAVEYVTHALDTLRSRGVDRFDAVAIVQPSSPFTLPSDIDSTVELLSQTGAPSAVSIVRVPHDQHPAKFKVRQGEYLAPYFEDEGGRATPDSLPKVYVRNGSVYVTRVEVIASGMIIGSPSVGFEMPRERSVDINDAFDLEFAQYLWEQRPIGHA